MITMMDSLSQRIVRGIEQLEDQAITLERFVADLSSGNTPGPDAVAHARHDITNLVTGLKAMRAVIERQNRRPGSGNVPKD